MLEWQTMPYVKLSSDRGNMRTNNWNVYAIAQEWCWAWWEYLNLSAHREVVRCMSRDGAKSMLCWEVRSKVTVYFNTTHMRPYLRKSVENNYHRRITGYEYSILKSNIGHCTPLHKTENTWSNKTWNEKSWARRQDSHAVYRAVLLFCFQLLICVQNVVTSSPQVTVNNT